jgi:hypothetical protein
LLADVEFVKSRDLVQAVDGGGAEVLRKNSRDDVIREAEKDLSIDKIGIIEFLNRITKKKKNIVTNMACFTVPVGYVSDESENDNDDNAELNENPPIVQHVEYDESLCIVCSHEKRNIMFFPCRDFKCCEGCTSAIAARSADKLKCPACQQTVESTVVAFV